jgi:hypothetical protein
MAYLVEWENAFTAKNGKPLRFRPEKASDLEMLWTMFSMLSENSISNLIPLFTRERIESWFRSRRNPSYGNVFEWQIPRRV